MSTIDPQKLLTTATIPAATDQTIDPLEAAARWRALTTIGLERPLTPEEVREMVTVTRILRRTTAGPAKAKTSKSKTKSVATLDDLMN